MVRSHTCNNKMVSQANQYACSGFMNLIAAVVQGSSVTQNLEGNLQLVSMFVDGMKRFQWHCLYKKTRAEKENWEDLFAWTCYNKAYFRSHWQTSNKMALYPFVLMACASLLMNNIQVVEREETLWLLATARHRSNIPDVLLSVIFVKDLV
jgi:hypothetical protein